MTVDSAPAVREHHDALLTQHLRSFLGDIEPAAMALLRERLTWVEIAAGETLIRQGEPGDSAYLTISGRLRVYVRTMTARRAWCANFRAARSSAR